MESAPEPVSTTDSPLHPSRLRLFRLIAVAGVVTVAALACIGAELAARYYERHRTKPSDYFPSVYYPHRRLRYGLVPNVDYYGWFRINSHGFRGREFPMDKAPGVFRIICLGGSTTFDTGSVGTARPWPEVLEAELRRGSSAQSVEVLNLGIGGATSLDSLIDLQTRAMAFHPDLVIVYQAHNDLIYSIPTSSPERTGLFPMEDRPRSSFMRWLMLNSLLYAKSEEPVMAGVGGAIELVKRAVPFRSADEGVPDNRDEAMERGLSDFRSNLRSIASIARANHIALVLPKVVVPFPPGEKAGNRCVACDELSAAYANLEVGKLRSMFDRYDRALEELAVERDGIYYITTDDFVPSADAYYSDPVHFNPEGSLKMGLKLAEALTPIISRIRTSQ